MRRVICVVALLFSFSAWGQQVSAGAPGEPVFVGYVYRSLTNINFKLYTHLCHAFITADENGVIRTNRTVPSGELVQQAHRAGVKVLLSLGGWGWDKQFAEMVSSPTAEDRYVGAVLKLVGLFDYDGVDLDWEYPDTAEEMAGFKRLCERFREALDEAGAKKKRHLVQTMAAAANPGTLKWLPTALLLQNFDWVHVMTYDMAGEWTDYAGHHSPLFASSRQPGPPRSTELTIKYLLDRGMPADRLALGIPLYGKGFRVAEPYASTANSKNQGRPPGGNYGKLVQLEKEEGWVRTWDDETKNPWLKAPDGSAIIGYDDARSVALKTEWAMKLGLRGVFFWEIGADRLADGTNPLQEASRKQFDSAAKGPNEENRRRESP